METFSFLRVRKAAVPAALKTRVHTLNSPFEATEHRNNPIKRWHQPDDTCLVF